tara:strand:+ start:3999 stop:5480 length:1482 start_codon:yes stop_codon:yes gene_type:complete
MEMLRMAQAQKPNVNGVRKTRWVIIRNTNEQLRTTTLNTWKQWIPEIISPVVTHPMIRTTLVQEIKQDGTSIEMEVYFIALDRPDDVKKLLSLEVTGIFINEAREIPYAVVKAARERIGRYPAQVDGYVDDKEKEYKAPRGPRGELKPCTRKALLMDTNPPDDEHWWYQLAELGYLKTAENTQKAKKETERIFDFFRGPAPLIKDKNGDYQPNPLAENIAYLDGGYQYYLDMIAGNTEDHINVQVLGNYGTIKQGKPVYPEYNDTMHCPPKHFLPDPSLPICLGWDFGLTPACVIGQMTSTGQVRVLSELCSEDMGVYQFARDVVKPYLARCFKGYSIGFSYGDPAGNNKGEGRGESAIGILNDDVEIEGQEPLNMGFTTEKCPNIGNNDITKRLNSVISFLTRLVNGSPAFMLDKRCAMLRKGFNGGYCYKRVNVVGIDEKYRDKPDKDKYSHPHDALQYLMVGFAGGFVKDDSIEQDEWERDYKDTNALGY